MTWRQTWPQKVKTTFSEVLTYPMAGPIPLSPGDRPFILICSLSFEELLARCWEAVQNFSVKCDPFSHSCIWKVRLASLYIATYLCSPYVVLISIILPPRLPDARLERRLAGKFSLVNPVPTTPQSLLHIPPLLKAELLCTWTGFKCMPGV